MHTYMNDPRVFGYPDTHAIIPSASIAHYSTKQSYSTWHAAQPQSQYVIKVKHILIPSTYTYTVYIRQWTSSYPPRHG